jgi:hypothetical protein
VRTTSCFAAAACRDHTYGIAKDVAASAAIVVRRERRVFELDIFAPHF